jgi:hypothetical protein
MAANSQSVIIQDPEILSGEPAFRGTRVFPNAPDYLEAGDTLAESLTIDPGSAGSRPSPRWKKRKRLCWLVLLNEDPHRRVPPSGTARDANRDGPRVRNSAQSGIRLQEER